MTDYEDHHRAHPGPSPGELGFEIREPTEDYPLTIVARQQGDGDPSNWQEFEGRTLSLPDLSEIGFDAAVQERLEGPAKVLSQTVYIIDRDKKEEDLHPGEVPGIVLSKHTWAALDGYEFRCVPGVDHAHVPWMVQLTNEQMAWIRLADKMRRLKHDRPEIELILDMPLLIAFVIALLAGIVGRLFGGWDVAAICAGVGLLVGFVGSLKKVRGAFIRSLTRKYEVKTCGQCTCFDEAEGKKEYHKVTHQFENGEGQMNKDISKMVAQERNISGLNEELIGYCTMREMLLERTFQCCPDFKEAKR